MRRQEPSPSRGVIVLKILALDTSGKIAGVAILATDSNQARPSQEDILLGERSLYTKRTHSQVILPLCRDLLTECNLTLKDIDRLAVATGPGSYTGIRIGIAVIQGMSMGSGIPCVGVSTLEAMAARVDGTATILTLMHAREELYYRAWFHRELGILTRYSEDSMLSAEEILAELSQYDSKTVCLVGDGATRFHNAYAVGYVVSPLHRLQSAAAVAWMASYQSPSTPEGVTARYLQKVNITPPKR